MLDENSGLVRVWVNLINAHVKTLDDVPAILNLREIVSQLIGGNVNETEPITE